MNTRPRVAANRARWKSRVPPQLPGDAWRIKKERITGWAKGHLMK